MEEDELDRSVVRAWCLFDDEGEGAGSRLGMGYKSPAEVEERML